MTLLIIVSILLELFILWKFLINEGKIKKMLLLSQTIENKYNESNYLKSARFVSLVVLICAYLYLRNIMDYILFLPMGTIAVIQVIQQTSEIRLYQSGIIINRKYIEWDEIEDVAKASSKKLILVNNKLTFGQLKSGKINDIESLIEDIQEHIE